MNENDDIGNRHIADIVRYSTIDLNYPRHLRSFQGQINTYR